ncbi:MAG: Na+/H+ antiporter NhaC family protein [Acidobacteriota bacterium]
MSDPPRVTDRTLRKWAQAALAALFLLASPAASALELDAAASGIALTGGEAKVEVTLADLPATTPLAVTVRSDGRELHRALLAAGEHTLEVPVRDLPAGRTVVTVEAGGQSAETILRILPGWLSVLPPILAIGLALLFKDVLISLFLGVFSGALILVWDNPLTAPFVALARSVDRFVINSLADPSRATIIVFTLLLGAMVGVISKSGGTRGIVAMLVPYATTPRRGQLATWAMGLLVFFDDYANTLIVGSTMRPVSDRLKISREKLAYMVDSTAAPIASIMPISTWIGFEVGLIGAALASLNVDLNPYSLFVGSIPYRFYPILALVLGFYIAFSGRDLGPMLKAERRARRDGRVLAEGDTPLADYGTESVEPPKDIPYRAANALAPILTVILVTFGGLWMSGIGSLAADGTSRADHPALGAWMREVFAAADPYATLLWSSLAGLLVALALPLTQRLLSLKEAMGAVVEGFKSMLLALIVLVLAWSIGQVCTDLHTADYLVRLTEGTLSPVWLPALVFVLSAAVAFATGSSWGSMGILVPLVIPIVHGVAINAGHSVGEGTYVHLLVGSISSVLAGSVWGDHCSPISDTTILSSIAAGSDHIAHVRTQLPYALGVGIVSILVGDILSAFGVSPWICMVLGAAIVLGVVRWRGQRVENAATAG